MDFSIEKLMVPAGVALILALALILIRSIAFRVLRGWAGKTETDLDDIVVDSLKTPSIYWCIAIGLYLGGSLSELPVKYVFYFKKAIYVLLLLSVTFAASNLSGKIFKSYLHKSGLPLPSTGLAYGLLKGIILSIGILITMSAMGISITPLITALGVGGLAVALALQDTLSNLFAGIHVLVEKSIRVGDFIRLETGQEGYVEDITWRTTRVRMLPNNTVIVPNSKLAQSVVTNYYLPERKASLLIPVGVSYNSDPERVEEVLVDEAKGAVGQIPGLLGEPEPFVRFNPGFGESSLDFTLTCQVADYVDQYLVQHELRKRILKRFRL